MKNASTYEPAYVDQVLLAALIPQLATISSASNTSNFFVNAPESLNEEVVMRHLIEHVFRIRMFRSLDSEATKWISINAPPVLESWRKYARSEAVHDRYFLRDLSALGLDKAEVDSLRPLKSTIALGAFVSAAMKKHGALPVVLYSFWTEQNSDVGTAQVIKRTETLFGSDAVRGASAHRALDEREDHADAVTEILAHLISDRESLSLAVDLLRGISFWVGAYFLELENWTRDNSILPAQHSIASQS